MHGGDRNRTSPFAFTGNKFEFRALGSSMSLSLPNTVLNTIVAEAIDDLAEELEDDARRRARTLEAALRPILQRSYAANKQIIFGGDNYSEEWHAEAEQRGLLNLRATPDALPYLIATRRSSLFSNYGVLSERELESRYEVFARAVRDEAQHRVRDRGRRSRARCCSRRRRGTWRCCARRQLAELVAETEELIDEFVDAIKALESANLAENQPHDDVLEHAKYMRDTVIPAMAAVREVGGPAREGRGRRSLAAAEVLGDPVHQVGGCGTPICIKTVRRG